MWNKLKKIHAYNGWIITILMATGILLFVPDFRGKLALVRVPLKQFHILLGVVSFIILISYLPFIQKHIKKIRKQKGKLANLLIIILFILIWTISGVMLWFEKYLSGSMAQNALFVHDLFTWLGVPIIVYHSITRLRWIQKQRKPVMTTENNERVLPMSRRGFIQWLVGIFLVLIVGPSFFQWIKKFTDDGGKSFEDALSSGDKNNMQPKPTPHADSVKPIGGGYDGNFRVYTVTEIPKFTDKIWKFTIDGLVERPLSFSWKEFTKLSRKVQVSDFHCVTGWSVRNVTYEGIPLSALLNKAGIKPEAKYVKFYSGDGVYTDALSLDQAQMKDVMVAMLMDGHLIPSDFGGPARLLVPKMYAYKSVKWLVRMELIDNSHTGYWQARGYDTNAWVKNI